MTTPSSPVDSIAKAMEGVTPEEIAAAWATWKSRHGEKLGPGPAFREAIEAVLAVRRPHIEALARQAEAMKRRADEAEALAERLRLEAQAHAMEARTANSTISEIYQAVSGGKGEPGNWHGATPVRDKLEAMKREMAVLRRIGDGMSNVLHHWKQQSTLQESDRLLMTIMQEQWDAVPRALIGGGNAED